MPIGYPLDYPARSPRSYAEGSPAVFTMTIALDVAKSNERIEVGGSSIWIADSSDIAANITVKFNNQRGGNGIPFSRGSLFSGIPFEYLFVDCTAQAGKWLTLVICDRADLLINNPDQAFSDVDLTKATGFDTVADATVVAAAAAAQILASNSTRRKAMITSLQANTQLCRIGDSNTGAARGIEIAPGESIEIETTEAIFAYTGAGVNQTLAIAYTTD